MELSAAPRITATPRHVAHEISINTGVQRIVVLLVVVAAWGLRLLALARQDIWWDEARNIDVALRPFSQVALAPELDIHPPVYFWLLHGWMRLNQVSTAMLPHQIAYVTRAMSVMAGIVSVALLYQLARRAAPPVQSRWAGALAATIGAFSPFWLAESQETRMYSVGFALLLGAAMALMVAWQRFAAQERTRAPLVWFVLLTALALLTHYNAVFIVLAWYVAWFVRALAHERRRALLVSMLECGLATAVLVAPVAPIALRQIPGYENPNLVIPSLASYLQQNWQAYWGGYAFLPEMGGGWAQAWLWFAGGVLVVGTWLAWQTPTEKTPLLLLLLWLCGGLALYYVAVLDRGAFNVRYASFVTPALYALAGIALAAWRRWGRTLKVAALVLTVALWPVAVQADLYDARFAREDIEGVTTWLREHTAPDAVIFVDQKYPFGFYYDRYVIDATETPQGSEVAPARYLFVDINTIDRQLQTWAHDASEVYWVQWFESDTDPRRAVAFLLDQVGERGGEQNFQGYSVDWWRMSPPNEFALAPNLGPLVVRFPPFVRAVEASLPTVNVPVGGHVPVVVRWARDENVDITQSLKARVALYDTTGSRISQRDERLLNDRHLLPAEWSMDDRPLNVYLLDVPTDAGPGAYTIGLLVYDADTLAPIGTVDEVGNPSGVEATLGTINIVDSAP